MVDAENERRKTGGDVKNLCSGFNYVRKKDNKDSPKYGTQNGSQSPDDYHCNIFNRQE
jgi:hypothetical protein